MFAELDVDGGVADEPPEFLGCPPGSRPAASVQISKLGYLSTIATSSTRQALLVDADGTLYRIAVGDRVGLGCLSVASIEPEGIMLQMRNGERLRLERKKRQD